MNPDFLIGGSISATLSQSPSYRIKLAYDDEHLVQDIILDNVCSNGRKITNIREANLMVNDYVENITIK